MEKNKDNININVDNHDHGENHEKCYNNEYELVNINDDDMSSLLKIFNINIPIVDDMIENIIRDLMITDDLNNNEKKLVKMFLNNLKKTNFAEIKILYLITFVNSVKKLIDNVEGRNFKQQLLFKGFSFVFSFLVTKRLIKFYKKFENNNIEELLTNILNTYSEHISYRLLNNIENNNGDNKNFKNDYQTNIELILKLNKQFMLVVFHYVRLINYMVTLYLVPILYDESGLTLSSFFKTTLINTYSMLLFNILYKKCVIKKTNEDNTNNNTGIEYFFNNIDKIVEGNNGDLKKELYQVSNELFKYFSKSEISKPFKFVIFQNERKRQTALHNFYETILSLIVNNTYLLLGSNKFKSYFDEFANNKFEFKILLNTTGNLLEVLNTKKYKISNTILWNTAYNYEYAFTLKNVSLEYNSINKDKLIVLTNLNLNFEINKFHFIYGSSGCGKTSLMKAMIKREKIENGEIKFLGTYEYTYFNILKYLNYVSSGSTLFPKSLYYNFTYKIDKNVLVSKKNDIMNEIVKYMNLFGLEIYIPSLKNKVATKLSKGQMQKVNIIYTILNIIFNDTKLVFLDEVTSNIDAAMEKIIYTELRNLNKMYPFTLFYVSHNLSNLQYSDYNYNILLESQTIIKNQTQ